jgi:NAD(P)-dependent dehydrogenase (short-subunit alcohol dehydrogenase family)
MRALAGKVVVVTGAGSGIGRALAEQAGRAGARLALSDWDEQGLGETAERIAAATGHPARVDRLDVRDRQAVRAYAESVRADLERVDVLVNNAGVALHGSFDEVAYEDFEWVMDVDFWGVVHGCKAFLPYLVESGDGHLVNVSSVFGLMAVPGQTAYNSAKFAVRGLTEALRQEMLLAGHPVQVTCVHPGGIRTAIVRNARVTSSHDKAEVVDRFDNHLARTTPERAAEVIWSGVLAGRPRVLVGTDAKLLDACVRLLGSRYQRLLTTRVGRAGAPHRRRAAVSRGAASRPHGSP